MKKPRLTAAAFVRVFAIVLIVFVPLAVLLGRAVWRFQSGQWLMVTIGDVIGYLSANAYSAVIVGIGVFNVDGLRDALYYIVDEAPAEIVFVGIGVVMYLVTVIAEKRTAGAGDSHR